MQLDPKTILLIITSSLPSNHKPHFKLANQLTSEANERETNLVDNPVPNIHSETSQKRRKEQKWQGKRILIDFLV